MATVTEHYKQQSENGQELYRMLDLHNVNTEIDLEISISVKQKNEVIVNELHINDAEFYHIVKDILQENNSLYDSAFNFTIKLPIKGLVSYVIECRKLE